MEETMYVVSHADMVEELVHEACGMSKADRLCPHYFIATDNDGIDVTARIRVNAELEYKQ